MPNDRQRSNREDSHKVFVDYIKITYKFSSIGVRSPCRIPTSAMNAYCVRTISIGHQSRGFSGQMCRLCKADLQKSKKISPTCFLDKILPVLLFSSQHCKHTIIVERLVCT